MNQFIVLTITLPSPITQGETWDEFPCEWGGGEWEITQGGTWDELPCEWGGGDKGGAK